MTIGGVAGFIGNLINTGGSTADGGLSGGYADAGLGGSYDTGGDDDYGGGYSYGGGYGGGGGGGGGGSDTTALQHAQKNAQLINTGGNYVKRGNEINDLTQKRLNDFNNAARNRINDLSNIGGKQLDAIEQQRRANDSAYAFNKRAANQQVEWQPNQQKEQSTLMALRNRMGNAAYGSAIQDLREGMGRVDDMNDFNLIEAWKQNMNQIYGNYFQTDSALVSDYNDKIADILDKFSTFKADYNNEISEMRSKYSDTMSDLFSQYWATMSNIHPELATRERITEAMTKGDVSHGEGNDKYTLPQVNLNPIINFDSGKLDVKPSDSLAKKLVMKEIKSATNPLTKDYVRPDHGETRQGGSNGIYNSSRAANQGFLDNLSALRRV